MKKILSYWHVVVIAGFLTLAAGIYLFYGEDSYVGVHDNLDLFTAQFQMMKNTGTFFAHHVDVPFLGGVSRDNLPSEFSLTTVLYMLLPSFAAYIAAYFLKIAIALVSCFLLAREWYGEEWRKYECPIWLMGFAYGILNVFPAFGIPFASIPLALWLLLKIYRRPRALLYAGLFVYPFVSYFSYFGLFILAYLAAACIWLGIRDRKVPWRLLLALAVLAAGYMAFEYRLFAVMLFGGEETIRKTIVQGDLSGREILAEIVDIWKNSMFHAESVHARVVLPVCAVYFVLHNGRALWERRGREILRDPFNLLALVLLFNSVVYGLYNWGAFRTLVETIIPPLKGWQFNRTIFFNPFLWYASFFIVLQRLYASGRRWRRWFANAAAMLAVLVIVLSPTRYNDLYQTCHEHLYVELRGRTSENLSYREFYSTELFEQIKEDIGYSGEWSAAYGLHPAVLEYNGIATLDGYLGFYPQAYKDAFRKVIAPALERMEYTRIYYDDWGARAYLYSGSEPTIVAAVKRDPAADHHIYIDSEAFRRLGGKYIFSRIELDNAREAGLRLVKTYAGEAYAIYLYEADGQGTD